MTAFSNEDRSRFLRFVTGRRRLPAPVYICPAGKYVEKKGGGNVLDDIHTVIHWPLPVPMKTFIQDFVEILKLMLQNFHKILKKCFFVAATYIMMFNYTIVCYLLRYENYWIYHLCVWFTVHRKHFFSFSRNSEVTISEFLENFSNISLNDIYDEFQLFDYLCSPK